MAQNVSFLGVCVLWHVGYVSRPRLPDMAVPVTRKPAELAGGVEVSQRTFFGESIMGTCRHCGGIRIITPCGDIICVRCRHIIPREAIEAVLDSVAVVVVVIEETVINITLVED